MMTNFSFGAGSPFVGSKTPSRVPIENADATEPTSKGVLAMARLSERRGQPDQAKQLYQVVIRKEPDNLVPYHRLGVMFAQDRDYQKSEAYFRKACEINPTDPKLLSDIGYSYYMQNRLSEAETVFQRAMELTPDDPALCNNMGILLGEQGRFEESLAMFQRAGKESQAVANLGYMYAQRGDVENAKACYSHALTLDTHLRPAAEAMIQLAQYEPAHEPLPPASDPPTPTETAPRNMQMAQVAPKVVPEAPVTPEVYHVALEDRQPVSYPEVEIVEMPIRTAAAPQPTIEIFERLPENTPPAPRPIHAVSYEQKPQQPRRYPSTSQPSYHPPQPAPSYPSTGHSYQEISPADIRVVPSRADLSEHTLFDES